MLILTRKSDESIVIGDNIEVKVLRIQGGQVHIGISAPREISVYRQEIFEQIRAENQKAMQKSADKMRQIEDNLSGLQGMFAAFEDGGSTTPAGSGTAAEPTPPAAKKSARGATQARKPKR